MATDEEIGSNTTATEEEIDSVTIRNDGTGGSGPDEEINEEHQGTDELTLDDEEEKEPDETKLEEPYGEVYDDEPKAEEGKGEKEPKDDEETADIEVDTLDQEDNHKEAAVADAETGLEKRNDTQHSTDALQVNENKGEEEQDVTIAEETHSDDKVDNDHVKDAERSDVEPKEDDEKTAHPDTDALDQNTTSIERKVSVTDETEVMDSEEEEEELGNAEQIVCEDGERDQENIREESPPHEHENGDEEGDILTTLPLFSSEDDTNPACVIQASSSVLEDLNVSASVERPGEGVRVSSASHLSHLTVGNNEELISDVIRLEPFGKELPSPVNIAIPYTGSPLPRNDHREIAFKVSSDGEKWSLAHARSTDIQFEDCKGFFAQLKFHRLCLVAVVLRLKREHFILESTGGSVRSSVDHRVALEWSSHPKRTKEGRLTFEVRPTTMFVHELKERDPLGYEWLLTMGPVVYLPVYNFRRAVTVTLPCPHHEAAVLNVLPPWRDPAIPAPLRRISQAPYGQMLLDKVRKPDDRRDALHVMMYDRQTQRWALQVNNLSRQEADTEVTFQPTKLADGYMVMRTIRDVSQSLEELTEQLDRVLRETYVCWILRRHGKEQDRMVVRCVTPKAIQQAEEELTNAGFIDISPVSEEVGLLEGQSVIISLGGNLMIDDEDGRVEVAMRFHANQQVVCDFWIKARDRFADRAYPTYRGTLMIRAEEPGGKRRLLCAMTVTLPKMEKRFERATRAKHADVTNDPLNNHLLDWLSFELGRQWEALGKALKQSNATLQRIKRNYPYDIKTQAFNMLYQWRQSQSKATDKVRELTVALKKSNNRVLAETLKERCRSSETTEEP